MSFEHILRDDFELAQGREGWWKELNCIFCYEYMIDGLDFHLYIHTSTTSRHARPL
jgi:hypothetical protein